MQEDVSGGELENTSRRKDESQAEKQAECGQVVSSPLC